MLVIVEYKPQFRFVFFFVSLSLFPFLYSSSMQHCSVAVAKQQNFNETIVFVFKKRASVYPPIHMMNRKQRFYMYK
jgi:hypothetical protein